MNPINDKINLNLYVMADGWSDTLNRNAKACFSTFFSQVNVKDGQQQRQLSINWNFKLISRDFTTVTEISLKGLPPEKLQTAPVQEKSCDIFAWGRYGKSSGRPDRGDVRDAFQAANDKKILKSSGAFLVMTLMSGEVTIPEYEAIYQEFKNKKDYTIKHSSLPPAETCLLSGVGNVNLEEKNSITSLIDKWNNNELQIGLADVQELVNKVVQKAFDEMKNGSKTESEEKITESNEEDRIKRTKAKIAARKAAIEAAKNSSNNQAEVLPPANKATQSPPNFGDVVELHEAYDHPSSPPKTLDEMKNGSKTENKEKITESNEEERIKRIKANLVAKKAAREAAKNSSNN